MRMAVIGAGHAGVEAATVARQAGAQVSLFSAEATLPYFRPRLVSVACGQTAPDAILLHAAAWYEERGIDVFLDAPVVVFDPERRRLVCRAADESFDAVVLSCGAVPVVPRIEGHQAQMPVFTLWSLADALALRPQIRPGVRLTVVGGGVLGLEAALRAADAGAVVSVVEKQDRLMPSQLGAAAAGVLAQTLQARGIGLHVGLGVAGLSGAGDAVMLHLDGGRRVPADVVLLSMGARPNRTLAQAAGLATARGVLADAALQTAYRGVFVAGDVAQAGHLPRGTVREAIGQGRIAGMNAVAGASAGSLHAYAPSASAISLKVGTTEVHAAGALAEPGDSEERIDDGRVAGVCRAVVRRAAAVTGVQMVGSREGFDALAASLQG